MRILVIGSGGREHALAWTLAQSDRVTRLLVAPGNPGTATLTKCQNVPVAADDIETLVRFASSEGVDFTVVGPEQPLAAGIVDRFRERDLRIFGPSQAAAQLEASKTFAKERMAEAGIPTASYAVLKTAAEARKYLASTKLPIVLKADGLAAGKGVQICTDRGEAEAFIHDVMEANRYGAAGRRVVAEEFLEGEEASFLVVAQGTEFIPLASAQDHKRLLDGDQGPNTGGMGAYSPAPVFTSRLQAQTEETMVRPLLAVMAKRESPFTGILYVGLMLTPDGPKVLEFNVRFGDPEAQAILPRLDSDFASLLEAAARGRLATADCRWKRESAMTVVLASDGYPDAPRTGIPISGVTEASRAALVFHAGTRLSGGTLQTAGGRVFTVTGLGDTLSDARTKAYHAASMISFEGKAYRHDIGWRVLGKERA